MCRLLCQYYKETIFTAPTTDYRGLECIRLVVTSHQLVSKYCLLKKTFYTVMDGHKTSFTVPKPTGVMPG